MRHYLTLSLLGAVACGGAPFSMPQGVMDPPNDGRNLGSEAVDAGSDGDPPDPNGDAGTASNEASAPTTGGDSGPTNGDAGVPLEASAPDAGDPPTEDASANPPAPPVPWASSECAYGAANGNPETPACSAGSYYVVCADTAHNYTAYCSATNTCEPDALRPGAWTCPAGYTSSNTADYCQLVTSFTATWPGTYLYTCKGWIVP